MKRNIPNSTHPDLIAPCGLNCRLCYAYARDKNVCPGCRGEDASKSKSCLACKIKNCEKLVNGKYEFCTECADFPCARLKHLDKRYRLKYSTSVIDNLTCIQASGIADFVKQEDIKWACPACGALLCMHQAQCQACGVAWRERGTA